MSKLIIEILAFEEGKSFGFQEYVFNLLNYFHSHCGNLRFRDIIIVCLKGQEKYLQKYADCMNIHICECSSILTRLLRQTWLPVELKLQKEDVILFTANYSSLLKRCKHVLVIHDLLFKRKSWLPNRLMRWQREIYLPISVRKADKVICISKFTEKEVLHYYPKAKGKIDVVYNYFNFLRYPIRHNIKKENNFISVCSSAYHKNTITVLKAFYEYCQHGGIFNLTFVGSLSKDSEAKRFYDGLDVDIQNRIRIYCKIDNDILATLYSKAKAYISASLFEGLGMPIVEAMYFNLPVILSDDEVFHEVSLEKGTYFNPLDYKMLMNLFFDVEHGICGTPDYSGIVKEHYSEENTSGIYVDILNSM